MRALACLCLAVVTACAPVVPTRLAGLQGQTVVLYVGPDAGSICADVLGLAGSPACSA